MPNLARKLVIFAAVDGLILQPLASKKDQRPSPPTRIRYGDANISAVSRDLLPDVAKASASFEAFGIVGLISVAKSSYLISITRRQQVATIRGFPIYVVSEVALTPCTSFQEAGDAVAKTAEHLKRKPTDKSTEEESDSDDDTEAPSVVGGIDDVGDESSETEATGAAASQQGGGQQQQQQQQSKGKSSIAQDVISRRGSYGRFAQRWFSKSGWMQDQKRMLGLSKEAVVDDAEGAASKADSPSATSSDAPAGRKVNTEDSAVVSLLPKLLRSTQILFGSSRSFFFSYDYDVTRSLVSQHKVTVQDLPLHKHVDPLYFWNHNTIQPFIDASADHLVLPLMQGFVGQRSFIVDSQPPQVDDDGAMQDSVEMSDFASQQKAGSAPATQPSSPPPERASVDLRPSERKFDITLISRRSIKRAGLRYLRRGVDEEGNVANAVESEQILSSANATESSSSSSSPSSKTYSFVQIRGSIPLFFTQTPYSLKPAPVIQHSPEANYLALKKHFDKLRVAYGYLQIVNLVEKHGVEASIGTQYERGVQRLNEEESAARGEVPFEWFDFHAVCRGMKFENVSLLLDTLGEKLDGFGSTVESSGGAITREQQGVIRTNCMDCLDRTNVCQSSFAKYMLDAQLREEGFDMAVQRDQENAWFNTLWADNGDAVSKQYASTGAMKGDYTRTRKRDYRGALADVGLSLTRFFNGMVNDFFLQTTIDFLLGNVTWRIFDEFEANMMTKDPAVSMQKMREQAIELCQKRVVADEGEEFIGGWTMLSPSAPDSLTAQPFAEVVLLLTDTALYLCRFDWNMDKVSSFERVELSHVERVLFGTYITSTISPAQTDELRNIGLVVYYRPGRNDVTRVNTRSISSLASGLRAKGRGAAAGTGTGTGAIPTTTPAGLAGLLARRPQQPGPDAERKLALKALHSQTALTAVGPETPGETVKLNEIQQVVTICAEIERLALLAKPVFAGTERKTIIEKGDIISLAEAKKSTGLLEHLGHSIKKMVWA